MRQLLRHHEAIHQLIIALLCIIAGLSPTCGVAAYKDDNTYGVDISFPIHRSFLTGSTSLDATRSIFGNDRVQGYSEFFSGCLKYYGLTNKAHLCHRHEEQRLELNRVQPSEMMNYTHVGYKIDRVSEPVWKMIQKFWDEQVNRVGANIPWGLHNESWPEGNTYTNHW